MYSNKIEFYFVRHGQTNWGREDILRGPQDLDLNSIGITQAKEAGMKLKKRIDRNVKMITSPLQRALQTTYYISEITNIQTYDIKDDLRERYYGDHRCDPILDAETNEEFHRRVNVVFEEIFLQYACPFVVVSHQKVFEWLSESLTKRKEKLVQGGIGHFTFCTDPICWKLEII